MIKEGAINFKFRSEREYDSITFNGDVIMVSDLKQFIEEKK